MKKILAAFTCTILLVSPIFLSAQSLSGDDIKNTFIKNWQRAKDYTQDYLNAMPSDKYGFKAVDSIRSFAQQMLHLASGNVGLIALATDQKPPFDAHGLEARSSAQTKDSVAWYVNASYDFAIAGIKALDASRLGELTGRGDNKFTRYAWLLAAFEHQTHHRGQTTIYIRLLGIRPPNERLF